MSTFLLASLPQEEVICRICEKHVPKSDLQQHSSLCAIETKCEETVDSVNLKLARLYGEVNDIITMYNDRLEAKTVTDEEKRAHKGWKKVKNAISNLLKQAEPSSDTLTAHCKFWNSLKELIEESCSVCYADNNCVNKMHTLLSRLIKLRDEADLLNILKVEAPLTDRPKRKKSNFRQKQLKDLGLRHTISQPLDPTLSLFRSVSEAEARVTDILKELSSTDTIPSILMSDFDEKLRSYRPLPPAEASIAPAQIFSLLEHDLCQNHHLQSHK